MRVGERPYLERMIDRRRRRAKPQRANLNDDADARRADAGAGREAVRHPARGPRRWASTRRPGTRSSPRTAVRAVRHRGAARTARGVRRRDAPRRRARSRPAPSPAPASLLRSDGPGDGHARGRAASCCRCRGWWASIRRPARRSPRRTAATGPYLKRGTDSRSLATEEQMFDDHARRGAEDLRRAQTSWAAGRGHAAAAGTGRRPGVRQADGDQGRPIRSVRHRR